MLVLTSTPFGSQARTRALLALRLVGESYPRELARLTELSLFSIQKALAALERDGLVAARAMGRTRVYRLNPRYFALRELQQYLDRLVQPETTLRVRARTIRRRPRLTGKPL
jgi:DNA-binding transcriptional ArsR family regulator